jgi:hypothetical protein
MVRVALLSCRFPCGVVHVGIHPGMLHESAMRAFLYNVFTSFLAMHSHMAGCIESE